MQNEKEVYFLFKGSVLLKGAISLFEIVAGLVMLLIPVRYIPLIAEFITKNEITEDPQSFLANHIVGSAHAIAAIGTLYIGLYLISRGAIKLGLIVALLKNKLWAYPWSLAVLSFFVIYQLYEITKTHSLALIGVTLFDFIVMYFIWEEYTIVKKKSNHKVTHG
jgi:uncharacterized membrane protein